VTSGTSRELKQSLGGEVITFTLGNNTHDSRVGQEIKKLENVRGLFIEGSSLTVIAEDAEVALPAIMSILKNMDVPVERVSISKPTLDDVFLKYAGTRLEDKSRVSEVARVREMIRKGGRL
jgi:ABC-2 type transport system ATP-binding protein